MKRFSIKFTFIFLVINTHFLFSQEIKNLDHAEKRLNELRNTNPDEVIEIGEYVLKHSVSDRQKSNTLVLMSFAYYAKKDTKRFTELLFAAKELAERTNDPEVTSRIYGTIAQMYLNIRFKDKAADYLQKTLHEIPKMTDGDDKHRLKGLTYIELGKIKLDDKENSEASTYYKLSLSEFNKINKNPSYFLKRSYYNLGNSFYELKSMDSAQYYLVKALKIKQNPAVNQYVLFTLSKIYSDEKLYHRAVDTLSAILAQNYIQDDVLKSEIYLAILKNYKTLGNIEKYNLYNENYLALHETISDYKFNTIENVVKIEEKDYVKKIVSARQRNDLLSVLLLSGALLSVGIFWYIRKKKKLQKKQYEAVIDQLETKAKDNSLFKIVEPTKASSNQFVSTETEQAILDKLLKFEHSDRFTNPKLTISSVAVQLKTNTTYLSQIVNKYKGKNFNTYINELRINYICEKIHSNPEYLTYKISYLGELAGFTSHSSFTTVFKNVTGISPSAFLRETEKSKKDKNKL